MGRLSKKLERQIEEHILKARNNINSIESKEKGRGNHKVLDYDFLSPSIGGPNIPFNHIDGELFYYHKIIEGLRRALFNGIIPARYNEYFIRSPPEIRDLLEEDNPRRLG